MARGGYRPGAGRPKGSKTVKTRKAAASSPPTTSDALQTPLEYMLSVMRDLEEDPLRRDRMAIAAAPFLHPRKEAVGQGKREKASDAAKAPSRFDGLTLVGQR